MRYKRKLTLCGASPVNSVFEWSHGKSFFKELMQFLPREHFLQHSVVSLRHFVFSKPLHVFMYIFNGYLIIEVETKLIVRGHRIFYKRTWTFRWKRTLIFDTVWLNVCLIENYVRSSHESEKWTFHVLYIDCELFFWVADRLTLDCLLRTFKKTREWTRSNIMHTFCGPTDVTDTCSYSGPSVIRTCLCLTDRISEFL